MLLILMAAAAVSAVTSILSGEKLTEVIIILAVVLLGIVPLVWAHRFSNRVGSELLRRNLPYQFNAGTFWLWNVLGSLIVVGPFVYTHKLLTAMNMLCTDYNAKG